METIKSCCCCLLRDADLKCLKTPYNRFGATEIYSHMLEECFQIRLILDNDDESGICDECVGRLRDAADFKVQVQRSQAELQARLERTLQVKEEDLFPSETADDGEMCSEPVRMSNDESPVKEELKDDAAGDEDTAPHDKSPVKEELTDDQAGDEDTAPLPWSDTETAAPISARSVSALARAQLAMSCSVRLERLRGDEAPHKCRICLRTFPRESSGATHIKETHEHSFGLRVGEEAYTCDTCGQQFARKPSLIRHVQEHAGTVYSCEVCSKAFYRKGLFTKHLRTHDVDKACKMYKKKITKKSSAIKCDQTYKGDTYSCEICNKQFTTKLGLRVHGRLHTGQKPYSCDICNKQFTLNHHLQIHARVHTGEKPFSCDICDKQFTDKSNMVRHLRQHTGQKPFSCEICNRQFTRICSLKRHLRLSTHTEQKLYSCDICNKQYKRIFRLKRHIKIHTR